MSSLRTDTRPVLALFALEAVLSGLLVARLPDIKAASALSNAAFGLVLLGLPAGTVAGFLVAPRTVAHLGLSRASWAATLALSLASIGPATASGALALLVAFALFGLCLSHTEVTQNAMAGHLERVSGRRVMSRCHGGWSLGSVGGLLVGGALAGAATPVALQGAVAAGLGGAAALALARVLPCVPARARALPDGPVAPCGRLPSTALLALCLLPLGTLAVEGVVRDWGAIFLRDVLGADPFASTLPFATLSAAMAAVRFAGDAAIERLGERAVAGGSILCASLGLGIVSVAPVPAVALIGAAVAGVGVALVYPIALSIAARRSSAPERDVAAVSFVCFVALMASPVLVGVASEAMGLRTAFAAVAFASLVALRLLPRSER